MTISRRERTLGMRSYFVIGIFRYMDFGPSGGGHGAHGTRYGDGHGDGDESRNGAGNGYGAGSHANDDYLTDGAGLGYGEPAVVAEEGP